MRLFLDIFGGCKKHPKWFSDEALSSAGKRMTAVTQIRCSDSVCLLVYLSLLHPIYTWTEFFSDQIFLSVICKTAVCSQISPPKQNKTCHLFMLWLQWQFGPCWLDQFGADPSWTGFFQQIQTLQLLPSRLSWSFSLLFWLFFNCQNIYIFKPKCLCLIRLNSVHWCD